MTDAPQPPHQPPPATPGLTPPPTTPAAPGAPRRGGSAPSGLAGMAADPPTLAATGLIAAVLFAIGAGLIAVLGKPPLGGGFRARLLNLTQTVDVGDVALLGIAVALLLLTPDAPGGFARSLLLMVTAALAAVIAFYGVVRALVLISADVGVAFRLSGFIATVGVAIAAATVAFYAAKESFLKKGARA